jgi:hypothetical protein
VAPVHRILAEHGVRVSAACLLSGSLVPPAPGKQIPRPGIPQLVPSADGSFRHDSGVPRWVSTERWTLHIPRHEMPAHRDPCHDCFAIELDEAQVASILDAVEATWGHRDPARLLAESRLLGDPPPTDGSAGTRGNS